MLPLPGTIVVWVGPAAGDPAHCSMDEHRRAARHRDPAVAERWLLARAQLRARLAEATGRRPGEIVLRDEPGGKPVDPGTDLHFNLSHAAGLVAIAIGHADVGPVGIDIETGRRLQRPDRLAARLVPDDAERARWAATPEPERTRWLLQRWTRTEALLKATGSGLRGGIGGAEERLAAEGWSVRDLAVPHPGVGALAARGSDWTVITHS